MLMLKNEMTKATPRIFEGQSKKKIFSFNSVALCCVAPWSADWLANLGALTTIPLVTTASQLSQPFRDSLIKRIYGAIKTPLETWKAPNPLGWLVDWVVFEDQLVKHRQPLRDGWRGASKKHQTSWCFGKKSVGNQGHLLLFNWSNY